MLIGAAGKIWYSFFFGSFLFLFVYLMSGKEKSKEGGEDGVPIGSEDGKKQKGYKKKIKKAGLLVLFPFRKCKKVYRSRRSTSSADPGKGCCLCFRKPIPSDSPIASQPTDPNSPEFGYEFVKVFIEKNDFYSRECNVHV